MLRTDGSVLLSLSVIACRNRLLVIGIGTGDGNEVASDGIGDGNSVVSVGVVSVGLRVGVGVVVVLLLV